MKFKFIKTLGSVYLTGENKKCQINKRFQTEIDKKLMLKETDELGIIILFQKLFQIILYLFKNKI